MCEGLSQLIPNGKLCFKTWDKSSAEQSQIQITPVETCEAMKLKHDVFCDILIWAVDAGVCSLKTMFICNSCKHVLSERRSVNRIDRALLHLCTWTSCSCLCGESSGGEKEANTDLDHNNRLLCPSQENMFLCFYIKCQFK